MGPCRVCSLLQTEEEVEDVDAGAGASTRRRDGSTLLQWDTSTRQRWCVDESRVKGQPQRQIQEKRQIQERPACVPDEEEARLGNKLINNKQLL